jgi:hypothetical protein
VRRDKPLNNDVVTIQDCLENYEKKGKTVIIIAGHVIEFIKEK